MDLYLDQYLASIDRWEQLDAQDFMAMGDSSFGGPEIVEDGGPECELSEDELPF